MTFRRKKSVQRSTRRKRSKNSKIRTRLIMSRLRPRVARSFKRKAKSSPKSKRINKRTQSKKQSNYPVARFISHYKCPSLPSVSYDPSSLLLFEDDLYFDPSDNTMLYNRNGKIGRAFSWLQEKGKMKTTIPIDSYKRIYFTSDIRADFSKLVQILVETGLIELPAPVDINMIFNHCSSPSLMTYVACHSKWIATDTLFVILGNLVNGARFGDEIYGDYAGNFELLIHVLLYNLRLQSLDHRSFVVFTIGNHDFHTIVTNDNAITHNQPVSQKSIQFFHGMDLRQTALLPFYDLSPYFALFFTRQSEGFFSTDQKVEIIGVNAGMHYTENNEVHTYPRDFIADQNVYTKHRLSQDKHRTEKGIIANMIELSKGERSPIWTSFYAKGDPETVCDAIHSMDNQPLVVVGHHLTPRDYPMISTLRQRDHKVLWGCPIDEKPRLVFVNGGLSSLFQSNYMRTLHYGRLVDEPGVDNNSYETYWDGYRSVEILLIENNELKRVSIPKRT